MVIEPDARLKHCPERPAGIMWPIPIDERLEGLRDLADEGGSETTRKELAAALVLAAPSSPAKLKTLIDKYRLAQARQAAVSLADEGRVLQIRPRKRGRRSKGTSQGAAS